MKKKMISLLTLLMMIVMSLGLAACGAESSAPAAPQKEEVKEEAEADETEESEEAEEVEETDETEEEVSEEEESVIDQIESEDGLVAEDSDYVYYEFRNDKLLTQHFEKHGEEMGFDSAEDYAEAACDVINNPDALSKVESDDGDTCYYVEATNEFVILSKDGYIRTYFLPSAGINYYNRQ